MKIAGIIAEYNPFHKGHAFQIEKTKEQGATHIVVVMSGNYVQRGDFAVLDKWTRAQMAIECGADLVLEMPLRGSLSSGTEFAKAGVNVLNSLKIVDFLSFGSECGDVNKLYNVLSAMERAQEQNLLEPYLAKGYSFPRALQSAIEPICEDAHLLSNPNDTLAISYLSALEETGILPMGIKRVGCDHDSRVTSNDFASASYLRERMGKEDIEKYLPNSANALLNEAIKDGRCPAQMENIERAVFAKLRSLEIEDFAKIQDVCEGLHNRIYEAVRTSCDFSELVMKIKTKRYTHARIRRILIRAALHLFGEDGEPAFIRILGIGKGGAEILNAASEDTPLISRVSQVKGLGDEAMAQFKELCKSTDFYMLSQPKAGDCDLEMTKSVCKLSRKDG